MKSCIAVVIISIHVDLVLEQHFYHLNMTSQGGNKKAIAVEFSHSMYICLVFTQKLHNIIMTFIAGVVKRSPVIQPSMIDQSRIVVLTISQQVTGFIILSFLAVLPEFFIVFGNLYPKLVPVSFGIIDIYIS